MGGVWLKADASTPEQPSEPPGRRVDGRRPRGLSASAAAARSSDMDLILATDPIEGAFADNIVWVIIGVCIVAGLVLKTLTTVVINHAREKSRREIAAYIAEGSITAEQGERLLKADVSGKGPANA
jgi:hypothetical protein